MPEMKSLTLNDKTYDCFVDSVARTLASATAVIKSASGESVTVTDASDVNLYGLRIFGKTTQDGVPTPDAPVDLVNVGDSGSITVNVTGENDAQSMTIATPNGLPGIPVTSGGNYTDGNGQQWVCDEKDYARGVYVKRVATKVFNGGESVFDYIASGVVTSELVHKPNTFALCSHGTYSIELGWSNNNFVQFMVSRFNVNSVSEFKAFLAEQNNRGTPVSVQYILVDPIETPLSEEELAAYAELHTYRNNTTVSNNDGAHMEIEYVMDAKKYIDSLIGTGGSSAGLVNATVE